jgi:hypothetical protein
MHQGSGTDSRFRAAQLLLRNAISLAAAVSAKHALPLYAE